MLKGVANELRMTKLRGWSVIFSDNEVVVRPADRSAGKFGFSLSGAEQFHIAFFSRELNYWNKRAYFGVSSGVVARMLDWMAAEALVPTKRTEPAGEAP